MKPSLLNIKHEINNILFKIDTSSQILEEGSLKEEELKHISQILKKNTKVLEQIFNSLFAIELLETKDIKKEKFDLKPILKSYLRLDIPKTYVEFNQDLINIALKNLKIINTPVYSSKKHNRLILYVKKPEDKINIFLFEVATYILEKAGIKTGRYEEKNINS